MVEKILIPSILSGPCYPDPQVTCKSEGWLLLELVDVVRMKQNKMVSFAFTVVLHYCYPHLMSAPSYFLHLSSYHPSYISFPPSTWIQFNTPYALCKYIITTSLSSQQAYMHPSGSLWIQESRISEDNNYSIGPNSNIYHFFSSSYLKQQTIRGLITCLNLKL